MTRREGGRGRETEGTKQVDKKLKVIVLPTEYVQQKHSTLVTFILFTVRNETKGYRGTTDRLTSMHLGLKEMRSRVQKGWERAMRNWR